MTVQPTNHRDKLPAEAQKLSIWSLGFVGWYLHHKYRHAEVRHYAKIRHLRPIALQCQGLNQAYCQRQERFDHG